MEENRNLKITLIAAAAASGKTTFMNNHEATPLIIRRPHKSSGDEHETYQDTELRGAKIEGVGYIVDGDDLVWSFSSWPTFRAWFREDYKDYVHFHNLGVILSNARLFKQDDLEDLYIVFNGGMNHWEQVSEAYMSSASEGSNAEDSRQVTLEWRHVEISEPDHKRNIQARLEKDPNAYPQTWTDAQNNRSYLRGLAVKHDVRSYSTFEEALSTSVKSRETVSQSSPTRAVIYGGPLSGKTTAHKTGIAIDLETPDFLDDVSDEVRDAHDLWFAAENKWKEFRNPPDREARGLAYEGYARAAYKSDIPVISSHFTPELLEDAVKAGRTPLAIVVEENDMQERIVKTIADTSPEKVAFRLQGTVKYLNQIYETDIPKFESYEDAVASL